MAGRNDRFPLSPIIMIGVAVWLLIFRPTSSTGSVVFQIVLLVFGVIGLSLWWLTRGTPRNTVEAADTILKQQKALYSVPHEFKPADPKDYAGVDLDFYDKTQAFFERQGFTWLGDIEDITATAQFPSMRTFLRVMSGDEGRIMLAIYHVPMRGLLKLAQIAGAVPKRLKTIDLETEFSDGRFLVTGNTLGADTTGAVPRVARFQYSIETDPEELLCLHREELQQTLIRELGLTPVPAITMDQVRAAQERLHRIKSAHKQGMGYMDAREFRQIAGRESQQVDEIAEELERRKRDGDAG